MPNVLFVIAPRVFRDEEYAHPREVLERRGAHVTVASVEAGTCIGKLGLHAIADIALRDAVSSAYDAVVFVGGAGASVFFDDPNAHALARDMHESDKIVAAICIAPSTLAHAGLLKGVRTTSFPSQEEDLVARGAIFTGSPVETDGVFITSNGPDAAHAFGEAIGDALALPRA